MCSPIMHFSSVLLSPTHFLLKNCQPRSFACYFVHSIPSNSATPKFPNLSALLQGHIRYSHLLQIHARIFQVGAHQDNSIAIRLIGQYPPHSALRVFHQLPVPSVYSFNAIIRVMAEEGSFSHAFTFFKCLKQQFLSPNDFTFSFLLKACSRSCNARCVKQIHTQVIKLAFMLDSFVCNGLLNAYVKGARDLLSGRKVFDELPNRCLVNTWTSLIAGCAQSGHSEEALHLLFLMVKEGLKPANDTMVSVLSACSSLDSLGVENWVGKCWSLLSFDKPRSPAADSINTILVYLYGKWGKIEKSRECFNEIADKGRSVLPWNAMIGAYVQNGCPLEALGVFHSMLRFPSSRPNHVTVVSVLPACAEIGELDLGNWILDYMESNGSNGIVESNTFLATAFIDMYSKCGSIRRARGIFDRMVSKDVVSLNAMIMGLAVNGEGKEALELFLSMHEFGLQPNSGTFLSALSACSHAGLLEAGRCIFLDMTRKFTISPGLEHYGCYIDLLSRVGLVEEALGVIGSMPYKPSKSVWGALFGGCLRHDRLELASDVSKKLIEMDPENSSGYVMLSNALAGDGRWDDVLGSRDIMKEKAVSKQPGQSWIGINGDVHEFVAGSPSHPQMECIHLTLDRLVKEMKAESILVGPLC